MQAGTIRIFLSAHEADRDTLEALTRHLRQGMPEREIQFWRGENMPPEEYRRQATQFLEKADLFLSLISVHYQDDPDNRWELQQAADEHHRRGGALRLLGVMVRSAFIPETLIGFPVSPGLQDPVLREGVAPDRQLVRVVAAARQLISMPLTGTPRQARITLALTIPDFQERIEPLFDRVDFAPVFSLLKKTGYDPTLLKQIFESEDDFQNLYQQSRGLKMSLEQFLEKKIQHRAQLRRIVSNIRPEDLLPDWESVFIQHYFKYLPEQQESAIPYFFQPTEEIQIPETLNLPVSIGEHAGAENIGLLSYQQKTDFRRYLLLAQDSMAVDNYARAHAQSEHVRNHIDPQSAQLYEYLLVSYLHKETPEKIIEDALFGEGRKLSYVTLYTGRMQLYQQEKKCPTATGAYNRRVAAEILADGMKNVYEAWPNDAVLDTGVRARLAPDQQAAARRFIEAAQLVYRAVHPMRGAFRLLINELCGGGKFNWISRVVLVEDEFRFMTTERFDLESQISELIGLVEAVDAEQPDKQYRQRRLLRENLYFSLCLKRQLLARQLAEEIRTRRHFTDVYSSVIRFVQSCLLGDRIFGDASQDGKDQSFLRLALEYLLPSLILEPDPDALLPGLRWFDLDAHGQLCAHPDSRAYQFVVEKMVRDFAGKSGWMQLNPNIHEEVYEQYKADTEVMYEQVVQGLSYEDFRRMPDIEARQLLIRCMRRWQVAYHAFPEQGQEMLDRIIREITGGGLMMWLYHDPENLVTHPDSLAYGFDARAELQAVLQLATHMTEDILRQIIADHLFQKRILPAFDFLEKDNEAHREVAVLLLSEAIAGYRLHSDARYLDFVYREFCEERKFRWIDIGIKGQAMPWDFENPRGFDPLAILEMMHRKYPNRFARLRVREQIAEHRYADVQAQYFHEISEYKRENRRPEREITIGVILKCKGIFLYMPQEKYLEIPLRELSGRGRIRWNAAFLGIIPIRENHFENTYYDFNYRYELFDCKRLLNQQYDEMQRVLKETEMDVE
jgi:hypothetical protein